MKKDILKNPFDLFKDIDKELEHELEIDNILVDIASSIILYRADNNLSQKQLAEKLELTQAMVSKLESGDYNPSIKMIYEIANKLDMNFKIEFGVKEDKKKIKYNEKNQLPSLDKEIGVLAS